MEHVNVHAGQVKMQQQTNLNIINVPTEHMKMQTKQFNVLAEQVKNGEKCTWLLRRAWLQAWPLCELSPLLNEGGTSGLRMINVSMNNNVVFL